jgi:DNA-directed RNA polymerase subunit RPC12/RpoP
VPYKAVPVTSDSVDTVSVSCNECGAPLEVDETTRFVSCGYCSARLRVHHREGAHFTEVRRRVKAVEKNTKELRSEVESLRHAEAIRQLDDAWEKEREQYSIGKGGAFVAPTKVNHILLATVGVGSALGAFVTLTLDLLFMTGLQAFLAIFLLLLAAHMKKKLDRYQRAAANYRKRRARLQKEHKRRDRTRVR